MRRPLASACRPRAARVWGGSGSATATGSGGGGTSLTMTAMPAACAASCKLCALCNFGEDNVAPGLVALTVEDVDNADTVYGEGDLISVIFDRATDRAGYEPGYNFFRAGVDGLFAFTHSLGER